MIDIALPHLHRAHATMFASAPTGHAQWIAKYILAHQMRVITERDVMRAYGALKAPEKRHERAIAMSHLVASAWLEEEPNRSPAKPPTRWQVNPAVHRKFEDAAARERAARSDTRDRIKTAVDARRTIRDVGV